MWNIINNGNNRAVWLDGSEAIRNNRMASAKDLVMHIKTPLAPDDMLVWSVSNRALFKELSLKDQLDILYIKTNEKRHKEWLAEHNNQSMVDGLYAYVKNRKKMKTKKYMAAKAIIND